MSLFCSDAFVSPLEVEAAVTRALEEDLGRAGDITTNAMIATHLKWPGAFVARQPGVIAGLDLARLAFRLLDPAVVLEIEVPDGGTVKIGSAIFKSAAGDISRWRDTDVWHNNAATKTIDVAGGI